MSGRHVNKVIAAVDAALASGTYGLVFQLRAVETALGLTSGDLTDPLEIVAARAPNDNRTPLVQHYAEAWRWDTAHREKVMMVDYTILVTYGAVDLEAGELFMSRYMTAIAQIFETDSTLGGEVTGAALTDGDASRSIGDQSTTRHAWAMGLAIQVDSP